MGKLKKSNHRLLTIATVPKIKTMKAKHILIEGRVQGVGFRYYVHQMAQLHGVVGRVRNLKDGRVEVLFIGGDDQWATFHELLLKGNSASKVENVLVSEVEIQQDLREFTIESSGVDPWDF